MKPPRKEKQIKEIAFSSYRVTGARISSPVYFAPQIIKNKIKIN
jgi:hypothetical protein